MKITGKMWLGLLIVALFGGVLVFASSNSNDELAVSESSSQQEDVSANESITFKEESSVVSYQGVAGETALATLKSLTDVRVEQSSFGEFVTGIGEIDSDSSKNFWGFYVNGEMAEVGAGDYVAKEGDSFEWQLTELNP